MPVENRGATRQSYPEKSDNAATLLEKTVVVVSPLWSSCGTQRVFDGQLRAYKRFGAWVVSFMDAVAPPMCKGAGWGDYRAKNRDLAADKKYERSATIADLFRTSPVNNGWSRLTDGHQATWVMELARLAPPSEDLAVAPHSLDLPRFGKLSRPCAKIALTKVRLFAGLCVAAAILASPAFGKSKAQVPLSLASSKSEPPAPSPENLQLSNGRVAILVANRARGPVLIFLHSGGGNAALSLATSGFATAARQAGFSVVFGNSRDGLWRYNGLNGTDDRSDEEYVLELREALVARGYGSRGIFVAGYSNGGMIGLQTVCDHPTLFEGIALISSAMPAAVGENCRSFPSRIVVVNGTEDPVMPTKGGVGANLQLGSLWSPIHLSDALLHRRQCARLVSVPIGERTRDSRPVVLFRATKCKLPGRTDIYMVVGGGHDPYGDEVKPSGGARVFLAPKLIIGAFSSVKSRR